MCADAFRLFARHSVLIEPAVKALAIAGKIWRALLWCVSTKKVWRWPRTSAVLIYDEAGYRFLLHYLSPWNPEVLHVRGEQLNMPVLLTSLASAGPMNRNRYVDRFVSKVSPRLIVTFIDNGLGFHSLAVRNQNVRTLFIQNGVKSYYGDAMEVLDRTSGLKDSRRVDYMMTFGSRPGAEYAKYIQGTVVPMGSLKNNEVPKCQITTVGTMAFVSQYRNTEGFLLGDRFCTRHEFFEQADGLVLTCLVNYARKHDKEWAIVPCSDHRNGDALKREQEYYNRLLGQPCPFFERRSDSSGYDATDSAEVVVTIDSALGYESAARGNKTAFFSIRSHLLGIPGLTYGWPGPCLDDGPFWTNRPDPAVFERILDHLFAIDDAQWRRELEEDGFDDIMAYDPGNRILQSVLEAELGAPR